MIVPIPFRLGDGVVGLDVDHGVHGLGRHGGDHVVDVHADLLEVALLQAVRRADLIDEDVADRGAGLVGDLLALEVGHLGDAEVLAHHHGAGRADGLDLRDGDQAALVVAEDEGRPGVGAHVDLPRHHLLHGQVAGRHREVLGLEPALLQIAGLHQVVGRHAPDVGLVALADGDVRGRGGTDTGAGRQCRSAGRGQNLPAIHSIEFDRHIVLPVRPDWPEPIPAASRIRGL